MGNTDTGVCSDIGNTNTSIHPVSYCPIWDEAVLIPDLTSVSATLAQTADEDAATFVSPVFSQAKEVLGTGARHDHLSSTLPPFAWDDNTSNVWPLESVPDPVSGLTSNVTHAHMGARLVLNSRGR